MRIANILSKTIALLGALILLTACSTSGVEEQVSVTPTEGQRIVPIESPTPDSELVYLVRGGGNAALMVDRVEDYIATLTEAAGNNFVVLAELSESDLEQNVKVIILFPPNPGLNELAERNPAVQFVAIGIQGLNEADNLTRIGPDGLRTDQVGFIAGVLAAAVTPDWRVGAISMQNSGEGQASNVAFQNGAMFFCGLCRPAYPPFHSYPVGVNASSLEAGAIQEAIDALVSLDVDTIFLSPDLSVAASVELLEVADVSYIGGESPRGDLGEKWIATVRAAPELAIADIWDRVTLGVGGGTVLIPLIIEDINTEQFTTGREAWVQEILQDLIEGYIDTGVDPLTGNAR